MDNSKCNTKDLRDWVDAFSGSTDEDTILVIGQNIKDSTVEDGVPQAPVDSVQQEACAIAREDETLAFAYRWDIQAHMVGVSNVDIKHNRCSTPFSPTELVTCEPWGHQCLLASLSSAEEGIMGGKPPSIGSSLFDR